MSASYGLIRPVQDPLWTSMLAYCAVIDDFNSWTNNVLHVLLCISLHLEHPALVFQAGLSGRSVGPDRGFISQLSYITSSQEPEHHFYLCMQTNTSPVSWHETRTSLLSFQCAKHSWKVEYFHCLVSVQNIARKCWKLDRNTSKEVCFKMMILLLYSDHHESGHKNYVATVHAFTKQGLICMSRLLWAPACPISKGRVYLSCRDTRLSWSPPMGSTDAAAQL